MKKFLLILIFMLINSGFIMSQSINITSPHSGDTFNVGSSYDIRWEVTGNINNSVKIRLFNSDLSSKILDVINNTPNSGHYYWKVPDSIGAGSYRIRVKTVDNLYYDNSEIFSISNQNSSITVIKPNGGENWEIGSEYGIRWSSTGVTGNINIQLFKEGNFLGPITDFNGIPVALNSYKWKVQRPLNNTLLTEGGGYKICIVSNNNNRVFDISDNSFSIAEPYAGTINIKKPSSGDIIILGNSYYITWENRDLLNPEARINIAVFKDDMVTKVAYVDNSPPGIGIKNTGSFLWHLNNSFQLGRRVIKITTVDGKVSGYSGIFQITKNSETVDLEVVDFSIPDITSSNEISKISVKMRNAGNNRINPKNPNIEIRIIGIDKLSGGKFTFDKRVSFYNPEFHKGEVRYFDFPMAGIKWSEDICKITFAVRIDPGKKIDEKNRKNNFLEKTFFRDEIISGKKCGIRLYPYLVKIGKANLRPVPKNGRRVLPTDKINIFMEFRNCCSKDDVMDLNIIYDSDGNGNGREKRVVWHSYLRLSSGQKKSLVFSNIKIPKKKDFRWLVFKSKNYESRYPHTYGVFYKFKVRVD